MDGLIVSGFGDLLIGDSGFGDLIEKMRNLPLASIIEVVWMDFIVCHGTTLF